MEAPGGIVLGDDQLDQDLMEDPSAWSSIAEQYAPLQDDLDMEVLILAIFHLLWKCVVPNKKQN